MTVYPTDQWLEKAYHKPERIFRKLTKYFHQGSAKDIRQLLVSQGMYHRPIDDGKSLLSKLRKKNVWKIIEQQEQTLKNEWHGKSIPIFIFPSDHENRLIQEQYNGRSGLAFHNKLLLFISEEISEQELKALFTHEYNHCCRLFHDPKDEKNYTLLDVVILEGLAENAVRERYGTSPLAPWTSYYTKTETEEMWQKIIKPNKDLPKDSRIAKNILYGNSFYPAMAGYSVGYYLVNEYVEKTGVRSKELLKLSAEDFISKEA